jgi:hypothetical protein
MDQAETVSRRVEKFAELMQSVWVSRNDYERRVRLVRISSSPRTPTCSRFAFPAPFRAHGNPNQLGRQRVHGHVHRREAAVRRL